MTREELIENILTEITNRTYRRIGRGVGTVVGGTAGGYAGLLHTGILAFKQNPTTLDKALIAGGPAVGGYIGGSMGGDAGEHIMRRFGTGKEAEAKRAANKKVMRRKNTVSRLVGAVSPYAVAAGAFKIDNHFRTRGERSRYRARTQQAQRGAARIGTKL